MGKFDEKAKRIFATYSGRDTLYFTSDGQAFFEENSSAIHAKGLPDKKVVSINRSDVSATAPATEAKAAADAKKKADAEAKAKEAPEAKAAADAEPEA